MRVALGVDIGGTKIYSALVHENGTVSDMKEIPTEANLGGKHVLQRVKSLISSYPSERICGIGVGASGQVGLDGQILSATNTFPNWAGIHLQKELEDSFHLPTRVVNDVQAMALGELYLGEGRNVSDFLCLALGTGVGGAIISNGRLIRGANGAAGEVGHMTLKLGGRLCPCGKQGCLEAYVSGKALIQRYYEKTGLLKNGDEIIKLSLTGHVDAKQVMEEFIQDLIYGIASLVTILNPNKVILGGGVAKNLEPFLLRVNQEVKAIVSPAAAKDLSVVISKLGGNAMVIGAAYLILNENKGVV